MNCAKEPDLKDLVESALKEDAADNDITTACLVPKKSRVEAFFLAKEDLVICGLGISCLAFRQLDKNIKFKQYFSDGNSVKKGQVIATISGNARAILAAERVALNFLCLLSGIATKTKKYVFAVKPYKAKILDTRKSIPGLRMLEKYAVRCGGGFNHRMALDEMLLVKDNHKQVLGDRFWVLEKSVIEKISRGMALEVEADNLSEFKKALRMKPDIIMLDNMIISDIKKAVAIRDSLSPGTKHLTPKLEASGGINLLNIRRVASTGVDFISIGNLTSSVESVDISLEINEEI
ncbi:MAG: carboxylating nicotinate-nucleotide diphosphorylase [Candidatus Omnitrophica bacterium]|nr:carboxylating nicotinate-nucleotide diphosphorylase [Candidatus Omnitrophota bacterium]